MKAANVAANCRSFIMLNPWLYTFVRWRGVTTGCPESLEKFFARYGNGFYKQEFVVGFYKEVHLVVNAPGTVIRSEMIWCL